jgi:hypothetical protein
MDLYEIYWWLVLGTVTALHNLTHVAEKITQFYVENEPRPVDPADPAATPEPRQQGQQAKAPKQLRGAGAFVPARANGRNLRLERKS